MIELDAAGAGAASLSAATTSWTHVIGSSANRILLVGVTTASAAAATASGVALDPAGANLALTRKGQVRSTATGFAWVDLWYRLAPPVGSWTITVTTAAGVEHAHGSLSLFGVDQTSPFNAASAQTNSNTGATAPTVTVTSNLREWIVGAAVDDNGGASGGLLTDGSGQTRFFFQDAGAGNHQGEGTYKVPRATSDTLSWALTASTSDRWGAIGVSLVPAFDVTPVDYTTFPKQIISDRDLGLS